MSETIFSALIPPAARQAWAEWGVKRRVQVVARFREELAGHALEAAEAALPAWCPNSAASRAEMMSTQILPLAEACRFLRKKARGILSEKRNTGIFNPVWLRGVTSWVRREPFGTVLIIGPGNYPLFLPAVQALQALTAGNAVLWKPAPGTTRAAVFCAKLLKSAGLPDGLFGILGEEREEVERVVRAGLVQKVICTGSSATGQAVLAVLAPHAIPSVMELSGCDAVLVRSDADLDLAARSVAYGLRLNWGQTCIAPRRLFIAKEVFNDFMGKLAALDVDIQEMLINQRISTKSTVDNVELSYNARPSNRAMSPDSQGGAVDPSRDFTQKIEFHSIESDGQFLAMNAACESGLGASIFTANLEAGRVLAEQIRVGVVTVNDLIVPTADPRLSFTGRGASGFGSTRGVEGLLEMTVPKVVTVRRGRSRPHLEPICPGDDEFFAAYLKSTCGRNWGDRLSALKDFLRRARQRQSLSIKLKMHKND